MSVFSEQSADDDFTELTLNLAMRDIVTDRNGVHKQPKPLNPDGISPRVLKELADVLAAPLITLFQASLDKVIVPRDWKRHLFAPPTRKRKNQQQLIIDQQALLVSRVR